MQMVAFPFHELAEERHAPALERLFQLRPGQAVDLDHHQAALVVAGTALGKAKQAQRPFAAGNPSPHLAQPRLHDMYQAAPSSETSAPPRAVPAAWPILPSSFHSAPMRRMAACHRSSSDTAQAAFFLITDL